MKNRTLSLSCLLVTGIVFGFSLHGAATKGILEEPDKISLSRITQYKSKGYNTVLLPLKNSSDGVLAAARLVRQNDLRLGYWIEIGRDEEMAADHPEWMASIQTHPEWRRFYPDFPKEKEGQVIKAFPWTPVLYKESFPAHLVKVERLLRNLPKPRVIYLNDLQGPPSVCGCGHMLCRWTTDYGPTRTATRLGQDAAARFIKEVQKLAPDSQIIPVWTTECEKEDKDGLCGGVGCYQGACWRDWTKQFTPVSQAASHIAVLALFKEFKRVESGPKRAHPAQWIGRALELMAELPRRYNTPGFNPENGIAILQGWDVSEEEIRLQIAEAEKTNLHGWILARSRINQDWTPKLFPVD